MVDENTEKQTRVSRISDLSHQMWLPFCPLDVADAKQSVRIEKLSGGSLTFRALDS